MGKVLPHGPAKLACRYRQILPERLTSGEAFVLFSRRPDGPDLRQELKRNSAPWRRGSSRREETVTAERPLVSVVDDDESVRESLPDLLRELGYEPRVFASAEAFLTSGCLNSTKCLVLDIAMPGMSGPELQAELTRREMTIPVIFITGQRDEAVRSRMLARGAVDCLFKPFSDVCLKKALEAAISSS